MESIEQQSRLDRLGRLGIIGGGALASALLRGLTGKGMDPAQIYVSDRMESRASELRAAYGVNASVGAEPFLDKVDMLLLAVKPKDAESAMEASRGVGEDTVVMSVIAGLPLSAVEAHFPVQPVFRIMPNVPQSVGEGMAAYSLGQRATEENAARVETLWRAVGRVEQVEERLMDAVTGLSGSGPAYAFLVIDAMADGGVAAGLPRATAIRLAAQTLLGSAKMVLETGRHPDELRDQVTSPAGTTIAGVRALERAGLRSALIEAVLAATERSSELGKHT